MFTFASYIAFFSSTISSNVDMSVYRSTPIQFWHIRHRNSNSGRDSVLIISSISSFDNVGKPEPATSLSAAGFGMGGAVLYYCSNEHERTINMIDCIVLTHWARMCFYFIVTSITNDDTLRQFDEFPSRLFLQCFRDIHQQKYGSRYVSI